MLAFLPEAIRDQNRTSVEKRYQDSNYSYGSPTSSFYPDRMYQISVNCFLTSSGAAPGSVGPLSHAVTRGVSLGVSRARATTTMTESLDEMDASRKNAATARVRSAAW